MVNVLSVKSSKERCQEFGMLWRGHTEPISTVADLIPDRYPRVFRGINGLQLVSATELDSVRHLLRENPSTSTRDLLTQLSLLTQVEPLIGEMSGALVTHIVSCLASRSEVFNAHYWQGRPLGDPRLPVDRVFETTLDELLERLSRPEMFLPTTLWSYDMRWCAVTYTDSPSTYLGAISDPSPVLLLHKELVCRANRDDPIDDWIVTSG